MPGLSDSESHAFNDYEEEWTFQITLLWELYCVYNSASSQPSTAVKVSARKGILEEWALFPSCYVVSQIAKGRNVQKLCPEASWNQQNHETSGAAMQLTWPGSQCLETAHWGDVEACNSARWRHVQESEVVDLFHFWLCISPCFYCQEIMECWSQREPA